MTNNTESDSGAPINGFVKTAISNIKANLEVRKSKEAKDFGFYWSRKSDSLAGLILESFAPNGAIVLDPFLGSGSTLVGAENSDLDFRTVGVDINEMPLRILHARFSLSELDIGTLRSQMTELRESHMSTFSYASVHFGQIILSKVIFDRQGELVIPKILIFSSPKGIITLQDSDGVEFETLASEYLKRQEKAKQAISRLPGLELIPNSRIAVKEGMRVSDIFTPENFEFLYSLKSAASENPELKVVLASCLHQCRITDTGSQSQFPYWVPTKDAVSRNPVNVIFKKLDQIEKIVSERQMSLFAKSGRVFSQTFSELADGGRKSHLLIQSPIQNIDSSIIPDSAVDFVLTDPPYYDQVAYSEYLALWEYFCGYSTDLKNEVVQSNRRDFPASRNSYLELMEASFKNISRMMKPGAFAVVYFKDSKLQNIWDFLLLMESSGLEYIAQTHLAKPNYTYKQNTSQENTVSGDAIYVFQRMGETFESITVSESPVTLQDLLEEIDRYLHKNSPVRFTQILDECIIPLLWQAKNFDAFSSQEAIAKFFDENFITDRVSRNVTRKST